MLQPIDNSIDVPKDTEVVISIVSGGTIDINTLNVDIDDNGEKTIPSVAILNGTFSNNWTGEIYDVSLAQDMSELIVVCIRPVNSPIYSNRFQIDVDVEVVI